jgi:hypothetical protein
MKTRSAKPRASQRQLRVEQQAQRRARPLQSNVSNCSRAETRALVHDRGSGVDRRLSLRSCHDGQSVSEAVSQRLCEYLAGNDALCVQIRLFCLEDFLCQCSCAQ